MDNDPLAAARGILLALTVSLIGWAIVGYVVIGTLAR